MSVKEIALASSLHSTFLRAVSDTMTRLSLCRVFLELPNISDLPSFRPSVILSPLDCLFFHIIPAGFGVGLSIFLAFLIYLLS